MDIPSRFNVIEILSGRLAGRICVVPVKTPKPSPRRPLVLRNARYRLCNVSFEFADGFASGMLVERSTGKGIPRD